MTLLDMTFLLMDLMGQRFELELLDGLLDLLEEPGLEHLEMKLGDVRSKG